MKYQIAPLSQTGMRNHKTVVWDEKATDEKVDGWAKDKW